MKTITKYHVRYKTRAGRVNPFMPVIKSTTYTISYQDENKAMLQKNIMNYDNIKEIKIFLKRYIIVFNIIIPIGRKKLFDSNKEHV